jgi:rubrerythrin
MSLPQNSNQLKPASTLDSQQTISYLIRQAIEAENYARGIYIQLSYMFAHVPDISHFWKDLANDETEHTNILKEIQGSLSADQLDAPADSKLLDSIGKVLSFLNSISLEAIGTLDEAYEIAHELEFSEVNYIFECVTNDFVTSSDRNRILSLQIRDHQKKLLGFAGNFGDQAWRRQILVRFDPSAPSE